RGVVAARTPRCGRWPVGPRAAGWTTATWMALTMHGWWWPGRQVVVVAPCLVLAIAWWAGTSRAVRGALAVAGVFPGLGVAGGRGPRPAAPAGLRLRVHRQSALPGVARVAPRLSPPGDWGLGAPGGVVRSSGRGGRRGRAGAPAVAETGVDASTVTRIRALAKAPIPTWRPSISTVA